MNRKVCMLVSSLSFLDARLYENEAKSLVRLGYEVTIIAPKKNGYLYDSSGKPFTDRFREETFVYQGVKVISYDSEKRTDATLKDPLYLLGIAEQADIYHSHELHSFYLGKKIKCSLRDEENIDVKLIYDSRELVPDRFKNANIETNRKLDAILLESLKEVDYIISISESMKAWYLSKYPRIPMEVIYNSPPLATSYKLKGSHTGKLVVGHEGHLSQENINKICSITNLCSKNIDDFHFKVINGQQYGESITLPQHLQTKISIIDGGDHHSLPGIMEDTDVGFIDLDSSRSLHNSFSMPSEFFNYLNNGVPVVVSKCHDMESFIRSHHCGLVINKQNPGPDDYVKGLLYLYDNNSQLRQMSYNARKLMEKSYSWQQMEKRLANVYDALWNNETRYLMS